MNRPCILFFVKEPRPGAVKTRLARHLGAQSAARLYRAMAEDTLAVLLGTGLPVTVCHAPAGAGAAVGAWLGRDLDLVPQEGNGLGQRMLTAFRQAFARGADRAVLVGSDLPDLPPDRTVLALDLLARGQAPVFGPAADGGYYLAGFTPDTLDPAAFLDIPYSRPDTLARTLEALAARGRIPRLLPGHQDVDTLKDLDRLAALDAPETAPRTRAALRSLGPAWPCPRSSATRDHSSTRTEPT